MVLLDTSVLIDYFFDLQYGKESCEKAAFFNFQCRRKGLTIRSSVDLLIAEIATENELFLLHNDSSFDAISRVVKELKIFS